MWKYNSPAERRITPTQYDLTLMRRNCFKMFYACQARGSYDTAAGTSPSPRRGYRPPGPPVSDRQDEERTRLFLRAPIGSSRLSRAADAQDRQNYRHGALGRTT